MLKELLLQFILSLMPVFAFQLWHDKEQGWKGTSSFMIVFCGISMVLCMLTAPNFFGYELDFRIIPYLIGSLYGGQPALAILSLLNIGMRIPMLDSSWETISFLLLFIGCIPLIWAAIRPFQRASALRKERSVLLLMSVILLYFVVIFTGFNTWRDVTWNINMTLILILAVSAVLTATWLCIFMIESVREKQQLHDEVRRVSANYRKEVEKLQQFIDETTFAVILVDREGRITHFNELATMLLNLKSEYSEGKQLVGSSYQEVFTLDHGAACVSMLHQALKGTKTALVPFTDGEKTLLKTTFSLRGLVSNEIAGAALIAHDVTEVSQLRNEVGRMERLSLVGQMAASITHEIRNPMAVIRGFVQLIQERSPSSQQEYFRIVMEELDRANMIISDFLSLAQNRALTMERLSLNTIINELVPLLNADANLRGQTIEVSFSEELPLIMLNDREIKQLLLNLARNGMEAMGDKGILRISTRYLNDKIELRIADSGVGISPEQMKHLFEPFFTTKTRGTGLGLPLCLSIVERHNGRIDVESKEGEGTTFVISFLLRQERAANAG
ncbi:ATP-binding protein [Paenibacillus sp. sgz302251]|uniref:ATP-binding protein n=1 Tax=Paenibacillus sp. sgz302251 TaxID=3414493 RepID=UPI003C7A1CCE